MKKGFLQRLSGGIVRARFVLYGVFAVLIAASIVLMPKVKINYDITQYLPSESETRLALDIMAKEFGDNGSASVMVGGLSVQEATALKAELAGLPGVQAVEFEDTAAFYKDGYSLFRITLQGRLTAAEETAAVDSIREAVEGMDAYLAGSSVHNTFFQKSVAREMTVILAVSLSIILVVLLVTSKSYLEIAVFLIVFAVAAVVNMGTNYFLGSISFITNSIAVVLQLALAIDYAIIFSHRYTEEREHQPVREAVTAALAKSIPAILSSSLTTISGLVALMFMQFRIGFDIGIVLAKGIVISFLTVFLLMPGLIMLMSKAIDKTRHRSFLPRANFLARFAAASRRVVPFVALALVVTAGGLQSLNRYTFSDTSYPTSHKTEYARDAEKIAAVFGESNTLAVVVPKGNYEAERKIWELVSQKEIVTGATGLVSVQLAEGVGLVDPISYRTFAAFTGISEASCKAAYNFYSLTHAFRPADENFCVRLPDMVNFLYEQRETLRLDEATQALLTEAKAALDEAVSLFEGERYSRVIFTVNGGVEDEASFALVEQLHEEIKPYYEEFYLLGDIVSYYDISQSFFSDNVKINVMTVLFILVILLLNFRSFSIPVILILTIQGSIWINFAIGNLFGTPLLFMSYLIVSAIHMGATIDYAILVTSRYLEYRKTLGKKQAITETLVAVFPTVMTSATILTVAGFVVGGISTIPYIFTIGLLLGRGTLISLIMVLVVLPQLLLLLDKVIQKTFWHLPGKGKTAVQFAPEEVANSADCTPAEDSSGEGPADGAYDAPDPAADV